MIQLQKNYYCKEKDLICQYCIVHNNYISISNIRNYFTIISFFL